MTEMKDDIFRNPARANPAAIPKHIPEYVRLGIKPIEMPAKTPTISATSEYYFENASAHDEDGNEVEIPSGEVIDNNDYVDLGPYASNHETPAPKQNKSSSSAPNVGEYLLMVFNKIVMSGSLSSIEAKVKAIAYGEDKEFASMEVSTDDIIVLKRLNIRVGIFIEE